MSGKFDIINVVDVEATCWDTPRGVPPEGMTSEIIEVGITQLNVNTFERSERESILIKPEQSDVSEFCTKLTGWTFDDLKDAGNYQDAVTVLKKKYNSPQYIWGSWGDYDRKAFDKMSNLFDVKYPFGPTHINIKTLFSLVQGLKRGYGMEKAFELMGWEMDGVHHKGCDDAWNTARLMAWILSAMKRGAILPN